MKTKSYIAISVLITFISFTSAECFDKYCWNNSDEMFIAAEQQFIQDLENGLHDHEPTKSNLCEYHLSSIAYGFSMVESGVGKSKMVDKTNNWFSVKKGSGNYQYKWAAERGYLPESKYLKYPHEFFSALDFMYLFKYAYGCQLSYGNIAVYKTGLLKGDENTQRYYDNLISSIKRFEKKYFGSSEQVYSYNFKAKDNNKIHGSAPVAQPKAVATTKSAIKVASIKIADKPNTSEKKIIKIDKSIIGFKREESKNGVFTLILKKEGNIVKASFDKNDSYTSALKKVINGKYSYKEKINLIQKLIETKNQNDQVNQYSSNKDNINTIISKNKFVLQINKNNFINTYGLNYKFPNNETNNGESISAFSSENDSNNHEIAYNKIIKIISLNMILGFYKIIIG